MLGGLFKSREIDRFAQGLSETLAPGLMPSEARRRDAKAVDALIEDVEGRAVSFAREQRLGIYGKARLCRTLGECLAEAGVDPRSRETVMRRYLVNVARAKV
ncbi:MAG: hypothetical protein RJA99_3107 [Pseudomonadota bacterium]